jgi:hypothetical protein
VSHSKGWNRVLNLSEEQKAQAEREAKARAPSARDWLTFLLLVVLPILLSLWAVASFMMPKVVHARDTMGSRNMPAGTKGVFQPGWSKGEHQSEEEFVVEDASESHLKRAQRAMAGYRASGQLHPETEREVLLRWHQVIG